MSEAGKMRVAVLGAGIGGLMAMKSCLEEHLEPICFEQHDQIGGIWNFSESERPNQGGAAFRHLVTNTSKEFVCASDFPFSENTPQFLPCNQFHEYLLDMAKHFDLNRYIHLNTTVVKVSPAEDFEQSGCWRVDVQDVGSSEMTSHVVSGVIVCTGGFKQARMPDTPGLDTFTGEFMHMKYYRSPETFTGKRVLILGNQYSAGDACGDAGKSAKQVFWSHGAGAWIMSRFGTGGVPHEFSITRELVSSHTRSGLAAMFKNICESVINHSQYGIGHLKDPIAGGPIMINDEIAYLLKSGRVLPKPLVTKISGRNAHFSDGTSAEVDVILAATGYKPDYSFVECPELQGNDVRKLELYKWTFPIREGPSTLGLIGALPLMGSMPPSMELQGRWIAHTIARKSRLPSVEAMKQHRKQELNFFDRECGGRVQMIPLTFQDAIADEMGVRPTYWSLLWKFWNFPLLKAVFQGPVTPIQYRLVGPGALDKAPEECLKAAHRAYNTPSFQPPYTKEAKQA